MSRAHTIGFSAFELIIMIALVAIMAAIAIPKFGAYGRTTLPTQAQAVADTVRRAQSLAVSRQTLTRVTVTAGANGSVSIAACTTSSTCTTQSTYTLSQNVSMGSGSTVYFNSLGTPVNASGIPLTSATAYSVAFGSASMNVSVAALTGRVTIGS